MRLIVLFTILVSGLTSQAIAQCTYQVSGVVSDEDIRTVLNGATVTVVETRQQTVTDSLGQYRLQGICPGHFTLLFTHVGCQPVQVHLHVTADMKQNVVLPHTVNQLNNVVVTGNYGVRQTAGTSILAGAALDQARGQSLGESLQRISGVQSLQTGSTIYKPVIQGMHSNRVLILNNGIRQEGQQWGSEHAPEIDPFVANRLTVIKGASALRYGSDAIGGMVLVEPRLLPAVNGLAGEFSTGFSTNNRLYYISGLIENNSKKHPSFAWRLQGTLRRAGNSKTPDYWLANSGLKEENGSINAGWRKEKSGIDVFYSLFNTQLGIYSGSHIGSVSDLENVIATGKPPQSLIDAPFTYSIDRPYQKIQHHLARVKAYIETGTSSRLNFLAAYQYNWRREYDLKRFNSSSDNPQLDIGLNTVTTDLTWDHYKNSKWRTTIGSSVLYQLNDYYQRFFIPNYELLNIGAFATEKLVLPGWTFEAGIRYDNKNYTSITRNNGSSFTDKKFDGIAANVSATWSLNNVLQANLAYSRSWRSPHVNEMFSAGLHHGAARLEIGDESLAPERANSALLGWTLNTKTVKAELNGYLKYIDDFIYLQPQYPPQLTIRGAFPLFAYGQDNARFSGADASIDADLSSHISVAAKGSIVRAWNLEEKTWIIQIPPDQLSAAFTYHVADHESFRDAYATLQWQYVARQSRVPENGNIPVKQPDGTLLNSSDYAAAPAGYGLLNAEAGTTFKTKNFPLFLSVQASNILNKSYRSYMNAFRYYALDAGFNFSVKLRVSLQQKAK